MIKRWLILGLIVVAVFAGSCRRARLQPPGAPSYYLNPLAALADERPVIFYDHVQAVDRGRADAEAGRVIPHEQVAAELRRKWLLGSAT
jgi:hypothetical protein